PHPGPSPWPGRRPCRPVAPYPWDVENICPLLTLGGNARAVFASPDTAHRCAASRSYSTIDREHQVRFCLSGGYEGCDRYRAHVEQFGPVGPTWGQAAPDATFGSTRLVVEAAPRTVIPSRTRSLATAVLIVVLLIGIGAAVAWAGLGGLETLLGPGAAPSPSGTEMPSGTSGPTGTPRPSVAATAAPTLSPTLAPTPAPAPTPVTYIVQQGDTLNVIAARYGTTAQAIMDANGLTSDVIHPGQVLIIPVP
ncbi:MAG: LysM peptidoglycan-binding domain-containing protein, partial [Candidatus Limnocylindria bacterium]